MKSAITSKNFIEGRYILIIDFTHIVTFLGDKAKSNHLILFMAPANDVELGTIGNASMNL